MVKFLLMSIVRAILMGELAGQVTEKVTVSPEPASATTVGSEPGPDLAHVDTVSVVALATSVGRATTPTRAAPTTSTRETFGHPICRPKPERLNMTCRPPLESCDPRG